MLEVSRPVSSQAGSERWPPASQLLDLPTCHSDACLGACPGLCSGHSHLATASPPHCLSHPGTAHLSTSLSVSGSHFFTLSRTASFSPGSGSRLSEGLVMRGLQALLLLAGWSFPLPEPTFLALGHLSADPRYSPGLPSFCASLASKPAPSRGAVLPLLSWVVGAAVAAPIDRSV